MTSYLVIYVTSHITRQLRKYEEANLLANIQLRKNDKIKNEYVLKLTHDIKGHLAAIQSCLDVTKINYKNKSASIRDEFLDRADRRLTVLAKFIRDLLSLTNIKLASKLDMSTFSINDCTSSFPVKVVFKPNSPGFGFLKFSIKSRLLTISAVYCLKLFWLVSI